MSVQGYERAVWTYVSKEGEMFHNPGHSLDDFITLPDFITTKVLWTYVSREGDMSWGQLVPVLIQTNTQELGIWNQWNTGTELKEQRNTE